MTPTAFDQAFEKVGTLVRTFKQNESRYLSSDYLEAEARKDFIDKFWIALGWDVNHDHQTNPYEQEVKVEPSVQTASARRRADYAFYLAPNFKDPRFFVEAKKPAGALANADDYFQTIRYGWNSQTPLAVLTDFDSLHILDCRQRPAIDTALDRSLVRYRYLDYSDRDKFAQIYWLFSREAVADHSIEKRERELPRPRGKAFQRGLFAAAFKPVDEAFLEELDEFRLGLARSFREKNHALESNTLTELAQRTLDRLVFLRFLEDRGIEPTTLVDRFGDTGSAWADFLAASHRLDSIYNGAVFKPHPLLDSPSLRVNNDVFADICENIAAVNTPYDFNSIPIHILGSIYERFLGKVIVARHRSVTLVEKEEVRKAGGVYYTPEYIVRYIVGNTVGKLIEGKTPEEIAPMRFVDIACGSGSFLLGVYDALLDYHGRYYNAHRKAAQKGDCVERDGRLFLSLRKRREVLLNNIYGVDIDPQAVEVAQLSLYLRLLKEETLGGARQYQLEFAHTARMKQLLPDLSKNVVCGNSLIGRAILDEDLFASEEEARLNPMDFEAAFPSVMRAGGFDAVVGNPPYVRMEGFASIKGYLRDHYSAHEERADYYTYFVERALNVVKPSGLVGMIVSNKFSVAKYGAPLRAALQRLAQTEEVADFAGAKVFREATVRTFVLTMRRAVNGEATKTRYIPVPKAKDFEAIEKGLLSVADYAKRVGRTLAAGQLTEAPWQLIPRQSSMLLRRLAADYPALSKAYDWRPLFGIKTGCNEAFVVDSDTRRKLVQQDRSSAEVILPFLVGKDVRRYSIRDEGRYVIYLHPDKSPSDYPAVKAHLEHFRAKLNKRAASQKWYELQQPAVGLIPLLKRPKIVYPIIAPGPRFALDREGFLVNDKLFILPTDSLFLLGLLNSSLARFFFSSVCARLEGSGDCYYEYRAQFVVRFPTYVPDTSKRDRSRREKLESWVDQLLDAQAKIAGAKTERDANYYMRKSAGLDREIDSLVNELYGLSADEIDVVEEGAPAEG